MKISSLPIYFRFKIIFLVFILLGIFVVMTWFKRVPHERSGENRISLQVNKDEVKFIVVGDTGVGNENQMKVARAMEKHCLASSDFDGMIMLGDNIYQAGVETTKDAEWQTRIEIPYGSPCLSKLQIYPVLGNHDYKKNPGAQVEYSKEHPRWHMPYRFYRIDFGSILRLIAFDSSFPDFCGMDDVCTVDFMRESLASSKASWNIVMAHHPLATGSVKKHGHSGGIFGFLMKPLVCGNADLWLSGHAHHMEYREEEGCDTAMVVAGGGGADLYEVHHDQPESKFIKSVHGFLELDISSKEMKYKFYNWKDELLWEKVVRK